MPVRGENRYNLYDNCSLHFPPSHSAAPRQRQGQICVLVVRGENLCQKGCKNFAHAIRWRFVASRSDDAIDFSLKKSVRYHVRKELRGIRAYLLDDVEVDDTLGSLSRLSDKIWFKTAINTMLASVWTFSKLTASDGNS